MRRVNQPNFIPNGLGQMSTQGPAYVANYSPNTGPPGTKIIVTGSGFFTNLGWGSKGQSRVTSLIFTGSQGSTTPTYTVDSDQQITITVPSGLLGDQKLSFTYSVPKPRSSSGGFSIGGPISETLQIGPFIPTEQAQQAAAQAVTQEEKNLQVDIAANKAAREAFETAQAQFQQQQAQLKTQQVTLTQSQADLQTLVASQQAQQAKFEQYAMYAGIGAVVLLIAFFLLR